MTGLVGVMRSMGAKKVKLDPFKDSVPPEDQKEYDPDYIPTVDEVLSAFGGKGTRIKR